MAYFLIALAVALVAAAPLTYPGALQTHAGFGPLYALMQDMAPAPTAAATGILPLALERMALAAGATPLDAWKAVHLLAFALGAAGAFLLGRAWRGNVAGLVTAALYTMLPYRLMIAYVEGDAGEALFWGLLPYIALVPVAWRRQRTRRASAFVAALIVGQVLWRLCVPYAPDPARATAYAFQLFSAQWGYGSRGDWLDAVPLQIGLVPIGLSVAALVLRRERLAYVLAGIAAVCALLSIAPFSAWWPWATFFNTPWQLVGVAGLCLSLAAGPLAAQEGENNRLPLLAGLLALTVIASYPYLNTRGIDYVPAQSPRATLAAAPDRDRVDVLDPQFDGALQAGSTLTVTLRWQPRAPFTRDYQVFVHVLDANGRQWVQRDQAPLGGARPTTTWQPGELLADPYLLKIPSDAPSNLRVEVGLYRLDTGARLPAGTGVDSVDVSSARASGTR